MQMPEIINAGVYRTAQNMVQRMEFAHFGLVVSGVKKLQRFYPDGVPIPAATDADFHLHLGGIGFISDFEFGPDRENWTVMVDFPALHFDPAGHQLYLQEKNQRYALAVVQPVLREQLQEVRSLFARMTQYARSAIPAENLLSNLMAAQMISRFLVIETRENSRAGQLKLLLDGDRRWRKPLREHCRSAGGSPDVLRREFQKRFGMLPGKYRAKLRSSDILSLLTYSNYSFKEIAAELGLKHIQHFNKLVRLYFNTSPSVLRRKFHQGTPNLHASPIH